MTHRARQAGGLLSLVAIALGTIWALGPTSLAEAAPAVAASPGQQVSGTSVDGSLLYLQSCASCHGPQGEGTQYGPRLVGVGAASADFYLRTGRMPLGAPGQRLQRAEPAFDEEQIQALVAFVAGLGEGPPIPQVRGGGDLREGRALYTANCAACHAATGSGNAVGGGFAAVGLSNADARTIAEAMLIGPGAMPPFAFDEDDAAAIATYVEFLRESPAPGGLPIGGLGPVAEGFVAIGAGLAILVVIAIFVGRRSHPGEPGPGAGRSAGEGAGAGDGAPPPGSDRPGADAT